MNHIQADSLDRVWTESIHHILNFGIEVPSRNGPSIEAVGFSFTVLNPSARVLMNPRRKMKRYYAAAELFWYLARESHIDRLVSYAPSYARFAGDDGHAYGAYGARIAHNVEAGDQITYAVQMLREKSDSRQCVISLWHPRDLEVAKGGACKDIPCTLTLQFLIRENKLSMIVNMRSNDLWLGTPYDCFCFMSIQALMAKVLNVDLGIYRHNVGSMHIYSQNIEAAKEAIEQPWSPQYVDEDSMTASDMSQALWPRWGSIIHEEKKLRDLNCDAHTIHIGSADWLTDCLAACATHIAGKRSLHSNIQFHQPNIFQEIK